MQQNLYGNNIIITDPSSNLRALGRNALAGKWQSAIIAVIVYMLCLQLPTAILDSLFGMNIGDLYSTNIGYSYNVGADTYSAAYNSMPTASPLSGIYTLLVTGAMDLGLTLFFLAMFRRQIVSIGDVFLGFERFGKALGLFLFQVLFIFLWSLLFLVPGIIAAIRYSQAFFILADDPTKGIRQCMDESKRMMRGNKAKYFCLSLSFIGWTILASIPAAVLGAVSEALYLSNFITVILEVVGGLCLAPVIAYIYSTEAGFYEILAGHLIKETEPAPIDPAAIPAAMRQQQNPAPPQAPQNPVPPQAAPQRPVQPQQPVNPVPQEVPQNPVPPQAPQNPVPPQAAPQRPVQPQQPVNPVPQEVPQNPAPPQAPQNPVPPQAAPQRPVQPQQPVNPVPQEVPQNPAPPQAPQNPEDQQ